MYACELKQYKQNSQRYLTNHLDKYNIYIVAKKDKRVIAFISITPPGNKYSIDKYVDRKRTKLTYDNSLFEIRVLTVSKKYREDL